MTQRNMRLVQVEDDPSEAFFLDWVIRRWQLSISVEMATGANDAIEYFKRVNDTGAGLPDVVLLDINMPQINGFELLKWLKSQEALRAVPVVMFSNSSDVADVQRSRELGADSYIVKPDEPTVLAGVLRILHGAWERREAIRIWPDESAAFQLPLASPSRRLIA